MEVPSFRGYEAATEDGPKPAIEWESWLKGTRRFPPSDEEIAINRLKQQVKRILFYCFFIYIFRILESIRTRYSNRETCS